MRKALATGAPAGIAGGLVFGAAMTQLGVLPTIAGIVRADSATVGFVVHMVVAATIGTGFALLVARQQTGVGETLFWGLTYGALWWFLGALTLLPLFIGDPVAWTLAGAQAEFPSLLGHLLYGATTALAYVALTARRTLVPSRGALVRGAVAGLLPAWLLAARLASENDLLAASKMMSDAPESVSRLATLAVGTVAGAAYAVLYPRLTDSAGVDLIRGAAYGFLLWIVAPLTVLPLLDGRGLTWSLAEARAGFETLPGYLLLGALLGLGYHWLTALARLLLSDDIRELGREGAGVQGVRALGHGALAGLVGGLVFTLIMLQIDFLPTVAQLVGSESRLTGFLVHLVIADLIGASYGVLFRRQSYDFGSAVGWGVAYGFCWWVLGALTLLPVFLGGPPQWTAAGAAAAYPALVGHLLYGAGLGASFYALEARQSPWWVSRTRAEAERRERRRQQVLSSAPALWALIVVIALIVPILLAG
jgi:uncharacterized membrane protein YagU involved in acid resistance